VYGICCILYRVEGSREEIGYYFSILWMTMEKGKRLWKMKIKRRKEE